MLTQPDTERQSYAMTNKLWRGVIQSTVTWFNIAVLIAVLFSIVLASNEQYPLGFKIITLVITLTGVSLGIIRSRKRNSRINKNPLTAIITYTALVTIALLFIAKIESPFAFIYTMPIFLIALYYSKKHVYILLAFIFVVLMIQPLTFYAITPDYAPDPNLTIEDFSNNLTTFLMIAIVARLITVTTLVNEEDRKLMQKAATKLHEEQEKTLGLIETVDIGIVTLSREMVIEETNSAFRSMFGLQEQLVDREITSVLRPANDVDELSKILKAISVDDKSRVVVLKTQNDKQIKVKIAAKQITLNDNNSENHRIVAAFQDVTQLKADADSHKLLSSILSHEFKTLLTTAEKRLSSVPGKLKGEGAKNKDVKELVITANEDIQKLSEINDKLIKSFNNTTTEGKSHYVDVDLATLEKEIYANFEPVAKINGIDFQIQTIGKIETAIKTDRELLKTSLEYIIDNAIKFSPEGVVSVSVKLENSKLKFIISDTGSGMTKSMVENLNSGDLVQADYRERKSRGVLGLGLMLARRQISALNGSLKFESELNKGTTVEVTIPT